MTLTLIAELLSGETLVAPGGAVDALTTAGHEPSLWAGWFGPQVGSEQEREARELVGVDVRR